MVIKYLLISTLSFSTYALDQVSFTKRRKDHYEVHLIKSPIVYKTHKRELKCLQESMRSNKKISFVVERKNFELKKCKVQ